ncbi:hypothetical protein [Marinifilum flexuosum]|uniref:hypothetical protein n=1 Tax=Marinifilum flexuosum TaxID=1117708 RepID=UPI00248F727F|nr:hypothetical protein [Marinifilum flexuosum]
MKLPVPIRISTGNGKPKRLGENLNRTGTFGCSKGIHEEGGVKVPPFIISIV